MKAAAVAVGLFVLLWLVRFLPADFFPPIGFSEELAFSEDALSQLASREFDGFKKHLTPSLLLLSADLGAKLDGLAGNLPPQLTQRPHVIHARQGGEGHDWRASLLLEYPLDDRWVQASLVLQRIEGVLRIDAAHVTQTVSSIRAIGSMRLAGKSVIHYAFAAMAAASSLLILYALVLWFKTPIPRWRWLWLVAIATGVMGFYLNWDTGNVSMYPASLHLLGGSVEGGLLVPWVVTFSLPLGAVVFLYRRRTFLSNVRSVALD